VLSNHVYATADWLLREFDKSESPLLREHADRVRCSFYSYNFHDVPPTFNPNRRIRVMIADYPKHRGRGRWKELVTHIDVAKALSIMLPDAPSGDYLILSLAFFHDDTLDDLDPGWSLEPKAIHAKVVDRYEAGMRAISAETDFNFGKYGIGYYLFSKMLWNAEMSVDELAAVRDRYLRRAFGAGWEPMRRYYELFGDMPVSSPNFWARAIRLIDEADQLIDAQREPAAQRRIDDVKLYWYYYYLLDSGRADPERKQMQRFLWQGQMSYQVAMHMVLRRVWGRDYNWLNDVLPESIMEGPAHYTHEQTQRWWAEVLEHWPVTPVRDFRDGALSDGTPAAQADVHDLVLVQPFVEFDARPGLFLHNRIQSVRNPPILHAVARRAGEEVGFKLFWTATDRAARNLRAFNASASYRAVGDEQWQPIEDASMNDAMPVRVETTWRERPVFLVTVRLKAPAAGVYRFEVGRGGSGANLTSLNFELATGETSGAPVGATYSHLGSGLTQTPAYLYIPKGTRSLDLEVWDSYGKKTVTLYQGLPPGHPTPSREVDISDRGTHTVALEPEETGTIAAIRGNGFAVPYFYSVPQLWAKSPGELLVPRVIAEADGLTIVGP
ncbi:MAG: hypothetical protein ACODAQ_10710, partial [Phycisphaeraceae bacterium]